MGDIVRLQKLFLESLGVQRLHAVAGPSMGGIQALQWGIDFPDWVDRLVVAVAGIKAPASSWRNKAAVDAAIASMHDWNLSPPFPAHVIDWLVAMRLATLHEYAMDDYLNDQDLQGIDVEIRLKDLALQWAQGFHPLALTSLGNTIAEFDVTDKLQLVRSKVLLALVDNDAIFPGVEGPDTVQRLRKSNVDAQLYVIPSRYGHLGSGLDWQLWSQPLAQFLT